MQVFVVTASDFPDAVFATEELANTYRKQKREENSRDVKNGIGRIIYYSVYSFPVIREEMPR